MHEKSSQLSIGMDGQSHNHQQKKRFMVLTSHSMICAFKALNI